MGAADERCQLSKAGCLWCVQPCRWVACTSCPALPCLLALPHAPLHRPSPSPEDEQVRPSMQGRPG